jgi:hypothetical protein
MVTTVWENTGHLPTRTVPDWNGYYRLAADQWEQDQAVGGEAHAAGGMTWPMYQALDALLIASGDKSTAHYRECDVYHFVEPEEGPEAEARARMQQYGYWLH